MDKKFPRKLSSSDIQLLKLALKEKVEENPGTSEDDFELAKGSDGKYHWLYVKK